MAGCLTGFAATALVERDMVPIGGIIQWSGSIATIPSNYKLCDGNNGTPDLTGRFVIGAGGAYSPDDSGGSDDPLGDIDLGNPAGKCGVDVGSGLTVTLNEPLPPYYALAFIMRTV